MVETLGEIFFSTKTAKHIMTAAHFRWWPWT